MKPGDLIQALIVVIIWGFNFVMIKTAVSEIPPLALTALRFSFVALLVAPFFRPTREQLPKLIWLALILGCGHFGMLFIGLRGADAATTALMIQLGIPFSVILATVFFSDSLGWGRILGMSLAFAGAALLAGEPHGATPAALGALLFSAFCWAWANILIKQYTQIHAMTIIGWMSLFSVPLLVLASFFLETDQLTAIQSASWKAWAALGYIAIGSSIIAYYIWYRLIARLTINQVVPFSMLAPMLGVAAGILILNEEFTFYKALGGLLTIGGITLIEIRQARLRKRALRATPIE
ncbi:DMT family transporter [Sedimenticola selenatireducens]|uniref:EamA family transporter n=1 Tax=Sedimenticola selenatireducens TaxID=191960 RepID=A0A557SBS4_9GAMM|nr:EamA family transporter [Sedimenticola selenatireducens]TVO74862.1 EamA family transporter [Sedimenticola selenatireducens]TVT62398.1 MAG: EamA family transporter [Sedimenticola selenatireducens]